MAAPRKYSDEQRERAVRAVVESGRPIAQIARDLGVPRESLRLWVRQAGFGRETAPAPRLSPSEREELARLRAENHELRRAYEILRTASALFVEEFDSRRPTWL